ncbi:MAG: sporulation protein YqfD [Eubacterium ventriosum]
MLYIFLQFLFYCYCANSAFIWKITIKGNYSYRAEQMIDYVHKKGVKEGVLKESD